MSIRNVSALVIGDLMLDRYTRGNFHQDNGPIPIIRVVETTERLGGAGNVAANLAALGALVRATGIVAGDHFGSRVMELLRESCVQMEPNVVIHGRRTTVKERIIVDRQTACRIDRDAESPADSVAHRMLLRSALDSLKNVNLCVISDYKKGVCHPSVIRELINQAAQHAIPVVVGTKARDLRHYLGATCLVMNEHEASAVIPPGDQTSTQDRAVELRARIGVGALVITLGANGSAVADHNGSTTLPAPRSDLVDATGAGDTLLATISFALAAGLDTREAVRLGNVAAASVVSTEGTSVVDAAVLNMPDHWSEVRPPQS